MSTRAVTRALSMHCNGPSHIFFKIWGRIWPVRSPRARPYILISREKFSIFMYTTNQAAMAMAALSTTELLAAAAKLGLQSLGAGATVAPTTVVQDTDTAAMTLVDLFGTEPGPQ